MRVPLALLIAATAFAGCRADTPLPDPNPSPTPTVAAPLPDSTVALTTAPPDSAVGDTALLTTVYTSQAIEVRRPTEGPSMTLRSVRWAAHDGYDRLVFTFDGDQVPGYKLSPGPTTACGSGEPVTTAGAGNLTLSLTGVQAHDETGHPSGAIDRAKPALPTLRELIRSCDFEGEVAYAVGTRDRAPRFRIQTLLSPSRLVVDLEASAQ